MKKIGKLSINKSKLLENEELVNLKGGVYEYGYSACCICKDPHTIEFISVMTGTSSGYDCYRSCFELYDGEAMGVWYCG